MVQLRLRLCIVFALFVSLGASLSFEGLAGTASASSLYMVAGNSMQIPAGGTGYVQVRGIAMQAGAAVPADPLALASQQLQAGDKARTAMYYGIDWGYSDSAPDQLALALWWTQDGNWQAGDHAIAQRIGEAAVNAQGIPSWNPEGRNLLTAISQGQASLSALTLTALQATPWVGEGSLAVQNTTGSDIVVYLPYGTLFSSASGSVIVWTTGTGIAPGPGTPTAQTALSPTPLATEPAQPTNTPAAIPTGVAPTDTPTPLVRKGVPPPQLPTDTPPPLTPKVPRATATSLPPSDTPVPPQPTDTPQPTSTPQPTNTPPPAVTPTPIRPAAGKSGQGASGQQQPPSQPNQPAGQQGNAQVNGNQMAGGHQAQQPASVPARSVSAPLPPTPGPTYSATPAAPAPAATGASAAAPPAVETGAPPPVSTVPGQATVPFPVLTVYPTAVPSTALPLPTQQLVKPTPVPTSSQLPGGAATQGQTVPTPPAQKPTPAPTAAPPPTGDNSVTGAGSTQATKPVKPTQPPVIVVGPATGGTPIAGQPGGGSPSGGGQSTPPKVNPVTGAGPSDMPLWLSAAALFMVLGGWFLRRVAHAPGSAGSFRR